MSVMNNLSNDFKFKNITLKYSRIYLIGFNLYINQRNNFIVKSFN